MPDRPTDIVTGAFSFTGRYVAERLLDRGRGVRTLTNHPDRTTPISDAVVAEPYRFDDPDALAASLRGADTLYNTYWERESGGGGGSYDRAVENTRTLVDAAADAGVGRIVHVSVSNATADAAADLPYYRAKAESEAVVADSSLSHAILRPTLVYGLEDILVNNVAWFLRTFPLFALFGDGSCRVRPVFVGDVADVAVQQGLREAAGDDEPIPVAGPEAYTFEGFVRALATALDARCRLVHAPPRLAYLGVQALELLLRDHILSWTEVRGLLEELLLTDPHPDCGTRWSEWVTANAGALGTGYTSFRERYD